MLPSAKSLGRMVGGFGHPTREHDHHGNLRLLLNRRRHRRLSLMAADATLMAVVAVVRRSRVNFFTSM